MGPENQYFHTTPDLEQVVAQNGGQRPSISVRLAEGLQSSRDMIESLVILPTYNERQNLPLIVPALLEIERLRILIVDDQSPDGTGELADRLAAQNSGRVSVLHRQG